VRYRSLSVSLLTELDAFFTEHRRCGGLEAGVDDVAVWMSCTCGARISHPVDTADRANARTDQAGKGLAMPFPSHAAKLISKRLESGSLPKAAPPKMWAGHGNG
jgi:hypothetical protein